MPRFLTGDELGNIKSLRHTPGDVSGENKTEVKTIHSGMANDHPNGIHALAIASAGASGSSLVAAAYADGSAFAFSLEEDRLVLLHQWKETRVKPEHTYIGLTISDRGIYSCTSNGALRITPVGKNSDNATPSLATIPTRLCDWRLSPDRETFAYGGDEVDLSVWNTERAFTADLSTTATAAKKRKRNDPLFVGEVWRARNVPNDFLGLRQPIRITSLTYLSPLPSRSSDQHHLLAGTQFGDVRRYDTRAARRPVSDWQGIGKVGGVKMVEKGLSEHEVFVSDCGSNLFSFDLRNGRVVYGYKDISGTVTSIAPSPTALASVALDRYSRIHTTFPPPSQTGLRQEQKGEVLDKVFMKSIPTVVVWDQDVEGVAREKDVVSKEDEGVWDEMEHVEDGTD